MGGMYLHLALALALAPVSSWGPVTTPDGNMSMSGVIERVVTFTRGPNGLPVAHTHYEVKGEGWLAWHRCGSTGMVRHLKEGWAVSSYVNHGCNSGPEALVPRFNWPIYRQLSEFDTIDLEFCATSPVTQQSSCVTTRIYSDQ